MSHPATIGNFRLLRTLGQGGMGVVFEAEHITMQRRAAIKVLRSELISDQQAIRRFFNEARATNEVRHPGIVQIYDCGTGDDGSPWLIMELLEGETLARRIERLQRVPAAEVITLGAQTASVLEAAHRAGIIHRDLKPDNLFIVDNQETPSGERVKVLDFGIAKLTSSVAALSMHTQTGVLMGTPLYMSPEQCRGTGQVDARSDIYSLGLILYQMTAGELPFVSAGMGELFDMQMNHPPAPLQHKQPGVGEALATAIHRALKKDPAQRFQTMAELQRALIAADAELNPARGRVPTGETPQHGGGATTERNGPQSARPTADTTLSAGAAEREPIEVPRHGWPRPALIAAGLLAAGGAIVAARSFTTPATALAPSPARADVPSMSTAAAATPAAPVVAPAPTAPPRITVDLKIAPAEARITDVASGRLIGTAPLHQEWERADDPTHVRIEKPGYLPRNLTIPRRVDFHGSLRLEREPQAPRSNDGDDDVVKL